MVSGDDVTPDEALVARTLAGDTASFSHLVRRHRRAAIAIAFSLLNDQADADDVAQESFIQAYSRLAECRHPEKFASWLFTIVRNRSLNYLRTIKRRRTVPLAFEVILEEPRVAERLEREEIRARLVAALKQLLPIQREILLLSDLEDWSHARIAEATGVSILMSRKHLSNARQRLRQLLADSKGLLS